MALGRLRPVPNRVSDHSHVGRLTIRFGGGPPLNNTLPIGPATPPSRAGSFGPLPITPVVGTPIKRGRGGADGGLSVKVSSGLLPASADGIALDEFGGVGIVGKSRRSCNGRRNGDSKGRGLGGGPPVSSSENQSCIPSTGGASFDPRDYGCSTQDLDQSQCTIYSNPDAKIRHVSQTGRVPKRNTNCMGIMRHHPFAGTIPHRRPSRQRCGQSCATTLQVEPSCN